MRHFSGMRVFLQRPWFGILEMLIGEENHIGEMRVIKSIEWGEFTKDMYPEVPRDSILRLHPECGQQLIDQLWTLGYRPSQGVSSTGESEAHKAHIADLRDIIKSLLRMA